MTQVTEILFHYTMIRQYKKLMYLNQVIANFI